MNTTVDEFSFRNVSRLLERHVPQQRIRYHVIPRFVVESIKLQPRSFPHNLPTGPHRPPPETSRPPALGLGSIRGLKDEKKNSETSQRPSGVLPPIKDQIREKKEKVYPKEMVSCFNHLFSIRSMFCIINFVNCRPLRK